MRLRKTMSGQAAASGRKRQRQEEKQAGDRQEAEERGVSVLTVEIDRFRQSQASVVVTAAPSVIQ